MLSVGQANNARQELNHRTCAQIEVWAEALLVERTEGDSTERGESRQQHAQQRNVTEFVGNHQRDADEAEQQASPLPQRDALAEHESRTAGGEQRLHADNQSRDASRQATLDRHEDSAQVQRVDEQTGDADMHALAYI